ncbi:hypothetical protein DCC39_05120 [Pueribacillus theae]|uniref:Phage holin family protein n=1 Tax=Pueribacillus theae TaxID=2171751 RepID=A0A2U1K5S8_9BACI|nr:phage holin family protein [Pueribacillus theae]PWA12605.1 hypothetical protein DCC39_05120 [Pueribacillus theae]
MLRNWIISLFINSVVLIVVAGYFPTIHLEGIGAAILASMILSLMNIFVKPFLILLTLPVTVLTLGLFLIVINAITLMFTSALMGDLFVIEGFGSAILAAIVIALLNLAIQKIIIEPLQRK